MKRFAYILWWLILALHSCKSITLSSDIPVDYDFKFDLYSHIKWYFRANLKYPSVNELRDFCWKIVNEANNNTYSSFKEFEESAEKKITGRENLLRCLLLHSHEISFEQKKGAMYILWNGQKWFKIHFKLCEMIKNKSSLFTYFYDSSGNYTKDFDYEEEFYKMRKKIRDEVIVDPTIYDRYDACLLRYSRSKGYQVCCPLNNRIEKNSYLKKLGCALDTFLLHRNIDMIQFVSSLPQSYFK